MARLKWKYRAIPCEWEWTKVPVIGRGEGYWLLRASEGHMALVDGLNYLGSLGWSLVAMQETEHYHGGDRSSSYKPSYLYIFKRPQEEE